MDVDAIVLLTVGLNLVYIVVGVGLYNIVQKEKRLRYMIVFGTFFGMGNFLVNSSISTYLRRVARDGRSQAATVVGEYLVMVGWQIMVISLVVTIFYISYILIRRRSGSEKPPPEEMYLGLTEEKNS